MFMQKNNTKKRALISVSNKENLIPFATSLCANGYELISTGGTLKALKDVGLKATAIDEVTGFPEMMDGRVKTLHPKIHGGLLARRDLAQHLEAAQEYGIELIDMVVVNLYPFSQTIQKPDTSLELAIENIDIGGPSMIRSAAKNHASVAVVVDPNSYAAIAEELEQNSTISLETKQKLAVAAFQHCSYYDAVIAQYLANTYKTDPYPEQFAIPLAKSQSLRYGENPHQSASRYTIYQAEGLSLAKQLQGKHLSYNNWVDLSAAWELIQDIRSVSTKPSISIIKHTNPCGTACANTLEDAYKKALAADPISAFGSIIACSEKLDAQTATLMSDLFIEAIIAPGFSPEALEIFSKKKNLRLLELANKNLEISKSSHQYSFKQLPGTMLIQETDNSLFDSLDTVTKTPLSSVLLDDAKLAYAIVKHLKSNAIVLVKDGVSIGIGVGQMNRVEAVDHAIKQAGALVKGAVCASDAFFPFKDSVMALAKAGVAGIIQPGGSVKDQESIDAANDAELAMCFTKQRHFKH